MTQIPPFLPFLSYCTESCHFAWSLHKGYTPFPWARTSRDRAPPSWCYLQIQKKKGKEKAVCVLASLRLPLNCDGQVCPYSHLNN